MSEAKAVADKYISVDGGKPSEKKILYITDDELRWIKKGIQRKGWMPYRVVGRDDAPSTQQFSSMEARGLVAGPPWRVTKFGREAYAHHLSQKAQDQHKRSVAEFSLPPLDVPLVVKTLAEVERDAIFGALQQCGGNKTKAAKLLGISIRTVRNKVNFYVAPGGV